MEYTKNYHLPQWAEEDRIRMEDFNQMCADIENGFATKADKTSLTEMGEEITIVTQEIESLENIVGTGGKTARIAWGSYRGNGNYGDSNPTVLTFDFKPLVIIIAQEEESHNTQIGVITMIRGMPMSVYNSNFYATPTWLENGVSMFSWTSAENQMNGAQTYYYVAIGQDLNA